MVEEANTEENGHFFARLFRRKQNETVRETIEDLIEEAAENGEEDFSEHEQLLLNNVLDLRDRKCGNAMIPRADIIAFPKNGKVMDLAELMIEEGHSRIPIYGESLDDIVGVVHVIDLVKAVLQNKQDLNVADILSRKIKFVSPEKRVLDLLKEMQQEKIHMAAVVDEYGGIEGLVTIEDLLEEIVGDIEDEYDHEEDPVILPQQNGTILVDGMAELEEIKETCGIDLATGLEEDEISDIDTVNSLILHLIQRVPEKGELISIADGLKFRILEADFTQVQKAIILKTPAQEEVKNG